MLLLAGDTVSVDVLSGDAVDFAFNSGAWDSEITFTILDPTGTTLGVHLALHLLLVHF